MEIDTNTNFDLPEEHPTTREITEQEQGLHRSPLKESSDKVQTAIALSEVLKEIAAWRRVGIITDVECEKDE